MSMRSAVYYPSTQVHNLSVMRSSLLLWDQLHTIVPMADYLPRYDKRSDMAEAWELIGATIVPSSAQKERAHVAIETTLRAGQLPPDLYRVAMVDQPTDVYEVWPQKFATRTWDLMREHRLTDVPLPNGDYPFTQEGGLLVMAKLADACAGKQFARVTDRLMAHGMIGSGGARADDTSEVVNLTLDAIDASSIPFDRLIDFRRREASERRGSDYTRMRHVYADMVQAHVVALGAAADQFERDELNRQFRAALELHVRDLREALGRGRWDIVFKPLVIASVVTAGTLATGTSLTSALAAGGVAAVGADWKEIATSVSDFFANGVSYSRAQKDVMRTNPMAYMYALPKH